MSRELRHVQKVLCILLFEKLTDSHHCLHENQTGGDAAESHPVGRDKLCDDNPLRWALADYCDVIVQEKQGDTVQRSGEVVACMQKVFGHSLACCCWLLIEASQLSCGSFRDLAILEGYVEMCEVEC